MAYWRARAKSCFARYSFHTLALSLSIWKVQILRSVYKKMLPLTGSRQMPCTLPFTWRCDCRVRCKNE